jgi:hypothetical protein
MRKQTHSSSLDAADAQLATDAQSANTGLPNRLMTAFEVADLTAIRRARTTLSSARCP